jgi:hypothetical protein
MEDAWQHVNVQSTMRLQARIVECMQLAVNVCTLQSEPSEEVQQQRQACVRSHLLATTAVQQLTAVCALLHQQATTSSSPLTHSSSSSSSSGGGSSSSAVPATSHPSQQQQRRHQQASSNIPAYHAVLLLLLPGNAQSYLHDLKALAEESAGLGPEVSRTASLTIANTTNATSTACSSYLAALISHGSAMVTALSFIVRVCFNGGMSRAASVTHAPERAAAAASDSAALRVAALQLTLELQLLAARLLQRSEQQQQQQQEVTREAAGLLENSNLLLLAQLECHVALLDWSPASWKAGTWTLRAVCS